MIWYKNFNLITIVVSYGKGCGNIFNNKEARQILANNIIYFRIEHGWSQEDLADKLGTTPVYVSSLENAKRNTRIDYINHIAHILDVDLNQLFIKREKIENNRIPRRPKNM